MPKVTAFLGIEVPLTTKPELLADVARGETVRVATLNPEFMLEARGNQRFREVLSRMTHCTIDGTGLHWALNLKGIKNQKYAGSSCMDDLLTTYSDGSKTFFFLGDAPGVAVTAAESVRAVYPQIQVVGATDGGIIDPQNPLTEEIRHELSEKHPDILFVGFGAPKQEFWIDAARELPVQVMIGIGGSLKFYGTKRRAPRFMQAIGLEWLFRAITESGHLKRVWRAVVVFPIWALFHR